MSYECKLLKSEAGVELWETTQPIGPGTLATAYLGKTQHSDEEFNDARWPQAEAWFAQEVRRSAGKTRAS